MSANMVGQKPPPSTVPQDIPTRVTAQQLAQILVLEAAMANLQIGMNQLGGMLKLVDAANVLAEAQATIERGKQRLVREWAGGIKIAQPSDIPAIPNLIQP